MSLVRQFEASKTVKFAWLKIATGAVTTVQSYLGHFEDSTTPAVFGLIAIAVGVADIVLRNMTTEPIQEKMSNG